MSEEEIIKKLDIVFMCLENIRNVEEADSYRKLYEQFKDLYHQEKEKNADLKALIEHNLKYTHNLEKDLFENCSNYVINKDKIKAKIEEYQKMYDDLPKNPREHMHSKVEYKIAVGVLQDLLEEEE